MLNRDYQNRKTTLKQYFSASNDHATKQIALLVSYWSVYTAQLSKKKWRSEKHYLESKTVT